MAAGRQSADDYFKFPISVYKCNEKTVGCCIHNEITINNFKELILLTNLKYSVLRGCTSRRAKTYALIWYSPPNRRVATSYDITDARLGQFIRTNNLDLMISYLFDKKNEYALQLLERYCNNMSDKYNYDNNSDCLLEFYYDDNGYIKIKGMHMKIIGLSIYNIMKLLRYKYIRGISCYEYDYYGYNPCTHCSYIKIIEDHNPHRKRGYYNLYVSTKCKFIKMIAKYKENINREIDMMPPCPLLPLGGVEYIKAQEHFDSL